MQRFNNILFFSPGLTDETEALKQALSIARNNNAELTVLIIHPNFSDEMADYAENYEALLTEHAHKSINITRDIIKVSESDVKISVVVEGNNRPVELIVRYVLKNGYDLLIKDAEPKEGGIGFKSLDMDLLRKCPCPIWLCRPINKHRDKIRIAVAIDAESATPEGNDLSLNLLRLSRSLADTCNGELNIISAWNYEFEEYLRGNVWIKVKNDAITKIVTEAKNHNRNALNELIRKSNIEGKLQIHHIRGQPEDIVPQQAKDLNIDILVMGTLARTGIAGFIIGNTAENILQRLESSLLALKPNGFVSPVTAY